MRKHRYLISLAFLILGVLVLVFAEGPRRFYSGGFFLMLAAMIFLALRPGRGG